MTPQNLKIIVCYTENIKKVICPEEDFTCFLAEIQDEKIFKACQISCREERGKKKTWAAKITLMLKGAILCTISYNLPPKETSTIWLHLVTLLLSLSLSFALPPFLPLLLLASLVGELLSLLLSLPKLTTQEVTTDSINSSYINSCYNRSPACLSAPSSHLLTPPHNNGRSSPGRTLPKNCCFFFFFFSVHITRNIINIPDVFPS